MAENPQPLLPGTIAAIVRDAARINDIAAIISNATGVPITALDIASPVVREMNKEAIDYNPIFGPIRTTIISTEWTFSPISGDLAPVPATDESSHQKL